MIMRLKVKRNQKYEEVKDKRESNSAIDGKTDEDMLRRSEKIRR